MKLFFLIKLIAKQMPINFIFLFQYFKVKKEYENGTSASLFLLDETRTGKSQPLLKKVINNKNRELGIKEVSDRWW